MVLFIYIATCPESSLGCSRHKSQYTEREAFFRESNIISSFNFLVAPLSICSALPLKWFWRLPVPVPLHGAVLRTDAAPCLLLNPSSCFSGGFLRWNHEATSSPTQAYPPFSVQAVLILQQFSQSPRGSLGKLLNLLNGKLTDKADVKRNCPQSARF